MTEADIIYFLDGLYPVLNGIYAFTFGARFLYRIFNSAI